MAKDLIGNKIGQGANRVVYEHKDRPDWVVKIPKQDKHKKLITYEGKVWSYAVTLGLDKYLVPVIDYDRGGEWLIMEKAKPIIEGSRMPKQKWMHDTKLPNWGFHGGAHKLLDYGSRTIYIAVKKMKDSK